MPLDTVSGSQSDSSKASPSLVSPSSQKTGAIASPKSALPTSEDAKSKALPGQSKGSSEGSSISSPSEASVSPTTQNPEQNQADKMGSKFAALSRKEREIQAKHQEVKAELAKLAQERTKSSSELDSERTKLKTESEAFASQRKEYEQFQALKKMNPLEAVKALGFSYEQLTEMVLNEGKPTPEQLYQKSIDESNRALDERFKQLEAREEARNKEEAERNKKALEDQQKDLENEKLEVLNSFRNEINEYLTDNSDEYELIGLNEANEIVYSVVDKHFEETGKVMSIKEASDITESWLYNQIQRNLDTKKLKAKASSQIPASQKESKEVKPEPRAAATNTPRTITNNMTSAAHSTTTSSDTEEDRIRRALAALDRIA